MQTLRDKYLDTLGIPAYLYRQQAASETPAKPIKCLIVEAHANDSFCQAGEAQDFLFKMLSAIGLNANEVALVNLQENNLDKVLADYQTQSILTMGCTIPKQSLPSFHTQHPGAILNQPELKREAWEVLKQLQSCLK